MLGVVLVSTVLIVVATVLALVRLERGPSMLDRTIALDVLTSALIGGIALEAAWSRRTDTIPLLVGLALVGFVGSVTIARFAAVEPEGEGRVLTREELAQLEAQRIDAEDEERLSQDEEHHGGGASGEVRG